MGRAPCCDKMGVKKGPWSPEEDRILVNYILKHGFGNWRALPKQAGLLRCGKSCRLRWTNYLRPDLKRGNLSPEEERTVIKLHEILGNKWSAIASYLPGRTDNEIKNIWNTHLKKRFLSKSNSFSSSSSNSSSVPTQRSHTSSSSSDVSHPPSSPSSSSSFMSTTDPLNQLHHHWAQSQQQQQQNVSVQDSPTLSRFPCDFHEQNFCRSAAAAAQQQQLDKKEATNNIDEFLLGNLNAPPSCRSEGHAPSLMAHYNPESRVRGESQNILGFDDEEIFRAEEQGFIPQEDDQLLSNAASNNMEFDPNMQFPDFSSLESFLSEPIEVDEYMVSFPLWFEQELHN